MSKNENGISLSQIEPFDTIDKLLESCGGLIGELSASCCSEDRGINMQSLLSRFADMSGLKSTLEGELLADKYLVFVSEIGGDIGRLYTTCCTPTREKIYQSLLTDLNKIFMSCWAVKGHSGH